MGMGRNVLMATSALACIAGTMPVAAQAMAARDTQAASGAGEDADHDIIVTAQKREERLLDVPVPVSAVTAADLVDHNLVRLQDYASNVPGLDASPGELNGSPVLTIRGLSTGALQNPTVGVVVDDIPYGPSSTLARGDQAPDFDPSDLDHVEVLRGPQGTLYGASSLGGLLKFVTATPSTDGVSGRLQGGLSAVSHGSDVGYNLRAAVNLPLSDVAAIRVSGFTRDDPGYIDNVQTGEKDVNRSTVSGGRASLLLKPVPDVSIRLNAMVQRLHLHGSNEVHDLPGLRDLQQSMLIDTGFFRRTNQAYSAVVNADLGAVDLVSLTGYSVSKYSNAFDFTAALGPITLGGIPGSGFNGFGVPGTAMYESARTRKFSQEVRLSGGGSVLDWLVGGYFTDERTPNFKTDILAINENTGAQAGIWLNETRATTFKEYAGFGNITLHVTDKFDFQVGGRISKNKQSFASNRVGPYNVVFTGQANTVIEPFFTTSDSSFTYLITPRYKISPDLMIYARFASGYRPGGPNLFSTAFRIPRSYKHDTTQNYELGMKGSVLDRLLNFDLSIYHIRWKDIQLTLLDPTTGAGYYANASRAKSQGIELALDSKPVEGLSLSGWFAYNSAKLTADLPASTFVSGPTGSRLPFGARFSGNISADMDFPVTADVGGFVGGSLSYTGERRGPFVRSGVTRETYPAYAKLDLRAGARLDSWTVNLFVNNVTDKRAAVSGGEGYIRPYGFLYIQPRTIGASLTKSF